MTDERWLAVPGWEGFYEVSSRGRVRSLDRVVEGVAGKGGLRAVRYPGRVLRLNRTGTGHVSVTLRRAGKGKPQGVHVLVCEAFHGPRPPGKWALHRDDVGDHNWEENLYWGTPNQNSADAIRNGRHRNARKEVCDRGHKLLGANLLQSRGGGRKCRVCQATYMYFYRHGQPSEEVFRAEADRRYALLTID